MLLHGSKPIVYEPGSLTRAEVRRITCFPVLVVLTTYITILYCFPFVNCFHKNYYCTEYCRRKYFRTSCGPKPSGLFLKIFLLFSETSALGLPHRSRSVTGDGDSFRPALVIIIIQTVHHITIHLKLRFRSLEQIFE